MKPSKSDQSNAAAPNTAASNTAASNTAASNPVAEAVPSRPATFRDYAASTIKVILLSGSLLGGLWLLQTVADK